MTRKTIDSSRASNRSGNPFGRWVAIAAAVVTVGGTVVVSPLLTTRTAEAGSLFNEFVLPAGGSNPAGITRGPDGNLWFAESTGNKIGRIRPDGTGLAEFGGLLANSGPQDVTTGPDGNLWFTENSGNRIGRMSALGVLTAEFALPTGSIGPWGIAAGPDGNLWFTEATRKIGRITPTGTVTEFVLPPSGAGGLQGITLGPDGNLWFAENAAHQIGRITPAGIVIEFLLAANSAPQGITAGPDGNVWFTERGKIGRIAPAGTVTEFAVPGYGTGTAGIARPAGITAGPDGNLWFAENNGVIPNKIARITPVGGITEFWPPSASTSFGITLGPDNNLWFTENSAPAKVGRFILETALSRFTEYAIPSPSQPMGTVTGLDRNLWFAAQRGLIGRVTATGVVTEFGLPTSPATHGIAAGSDGNLWFTEPNASKIGRITPAGAVTEFALPACSVPGGIVAGRDGGIWFAELVAVVPGQAGCNPNGFGTGAIGRIDPITSAISIFAIPQCANEITVGPDNNLWFTEGFCIGNAGGQQIGRITTAGVLTRFPVPTGNANQLTLTGITSGSDGNLWFTEASVSPAGNKIGRLNPTTGAFTLFALPVANSKPWFITAGRDGNLWFTERGRGGIGRMTTAGAIREFSLPVGQNLAEPVGITTGPDGNIWFADDRSALNSIGLFTLNAPGSVSLDASATIVNPGTTVSAVWSSLAPTGSDSIGLYVVGAADTDVLQSHPISRFSGSSAFVAPTTLASYEFRLFANGVKLAVSNPFQVVLPSLVASPLSVNPGQPIAVAWSNFSPSGNDKINLYSAGAPDPAALASQAITGSAGSTSFTAPTIPGGYEFRLFTGTARVAVSNVVQVTAPSLVASPISVRAGQPITTAWSNFSPTGSDRINLYSAGTPDSASLASQAITGVSGSIIFAVRTPPGAFEFRLFAGNIKVATSNVVQVMGPSLAAIPLSVEPGQAVTAAWSNFVPTGNDAINLYMVGAPDSASLASIGIAGDSGSATFAAPATPGGYEFRLFAGGTPVATSNTFQVTGVPLPTDAVVQSESAPSSYLPASVRSYRTLGLGGDPVNLVFGNYNHQQTDLEMPGIGPPVRFQRTFNSALPGTSGILGHGWNVTYDLRVRTASANTTSVTRGDGRVDFYTVQVDGSLKPPVGSVDALVRNSDGTYTLTTREFIIYSFSTAGRLVSAFDADGNRVRLTYSGDMWTGITDAAGREWHLTYEVSGRLARVTDPAGRSVSYAYDSAGDLTRVTNPAGGVTSYQYDGGHRLTRVTDANGHLFVADIYLPDGRIAEQLDSRGTHHFAYFNDHTVYTDPAGAVTTIFFDSSFRVTRRVDGLGTSNSVAYGADGLVEHDVDANGGVRHYTYDGRGNTTTVSDALGGLTRLVYDSQDNLITSTDPLGRVTAFTYDARHHPLTATDALGAVTRLTYSPQGLPTEVTDPLGNTTRLEYDRFGNRTSVADVLGMVSRSTFDEAGRVTEETDALGRTSHHTYGTLNQLLSLTASDGGVTTYTYDAVGNRLGIRDSLGNLTAYAYNEANDLVQVTDALGDVITYRHDALGRLTSRILPDGSTWKIDLDAVGRPIRAISPLNLAAAYSYDPNGNLLTLVDPAGNATTYGYDGNNHLTSVTDALHGVARYAYDAAGNRTEVSDALGHVTTFTYDGDNRAQADTDPMGFRRAVSYDARGRVTSETNGAGEVIAYTYDARGRLLTVTADDATTRYAYDSAGNRTVREDQFGKTTYRYDDANRLTRVTGPQGVVSYRYDLAGNRAAMDQPGAATTYQYDALNRLARIRLNGAEVVAYGFDSSGRNVSQRFGNGVSTALNYDGGGQLTGLVTTGVGGELQRIAYSLDAVGNRTAEMASGFSASYQYDKLLRLTQATAVVAADEPTQPSQSHSFAYAYDGVGNRLSATEEGTNTVYTYDAANRITTAGGIPIRYDSAGRLTGDGVNSYRYDSFGHLTDIRGAGGDSSGDGADGGDGEIHAAPLNDGHGIRQPEGETSGDQGQSEEGTRSTFRYDGDGNRITERTNGERTGFLLDVAATIPRRIAAISEGDTVRFIYGSLRAAQVTDGNAIHYEHADGLGSVRMLTDAAGQVEARSTYAPFGARLTGSGAFGFAGEPYSAGGQLLHLQARDYNPGLGRFMTPDTHRPLSMQPGTLNSYSYVLNNPVNATDPSGAWPFCWRWEFWNCSDAQQPTQPVSQPMPQPQLWPASVFSPSNSVIAVGGGNVIAVGGGNVIAVGGGNVIAVGGGNVIAVGGGNVIAVGGGNVIAVGGGNLAESSGNKQGANVIAVGGGNLVASNTGDVIAVGGGNVITVGTGQVIGVGTGQVIGVGTGQVIAVGGGNVIGVGTGQVIGVGTGQVIGVGTGQVIAVGGGNVIAVGGGNVIGVGTGQVIGVGTGQVIGVGTGQVIGVGTGQVIGVGTGQVIAVGGGT